MSRRSDRFKKILPTDVSRRGFDVAVSTRGVETGRIDATQPNLSNRPRSVPNFEVGAVQGDSVGNAMPRSKKAKTPRKIVTTEIRVKPDFVVTFEGNMPCPRGLAEEFYDKVIREGLKAALREDEKVRITSIKRKGHSLSMKYHKEP